MKYIILLLLIFNIFSLGADQSYSTVLEKLNLLTEMVENQKTSISDALLSIDEKDLDILIKTSVINPESHTPIAFATGVSTGAAQGVLCFDLNNIEQLKHQNTSIIWVTDHIRNDDLCYLKDISGIFALKEDPSSHAIIVTRVFNIPCLTLPEEVRFEGDKIITPYGCLKEGDNVTLDAFNGKLFLGNFPLFHPNDKFHLNKIMSWADEFAELRVHGNADTAEEAIQALAFGAKGIDPRTEHMFFHPKRLHLFRKIILSKGRSEEILAELESLQRHDFIELYKTMQSYPVKIRLLDPPLHEFLPTLEASLFELANEFQISFESLKARVAELSEVNPMMGHRGIRLLLTYPQILKMQVKAIFEAAKDKSLEALRIEPYIVLPMVINEKEILLAKNLIDEVRNEINQQKGVEIIYHLGAMMETPRACIMAETIAPHVDFISFGTNDLTGQTLALSRGDVYEKFLKYYLDTGLLTSDPFSNLDPAVRQLIKITVDQMRLQPNHISIGLCGEQGSEKAGVFACHKLGLDTVSCSPFRVPSVKLFAAQAAILHKR